MLASYDGVGTCRGFSVLHLEVHFEFGILRTGAVTGGPLEGAKGGCLRLVGPLIAAN